MLPLFETAAALTEKTQKSETTNARARDSRGRFLPASAKRGRKSRSEKPPLWYKAFLSAFVETGGIYTKACAAARIHPSVPYDAARGDASFAAAWEEARETATDLLEAEAFRRGVEGITKPAISGGKIVKDDEGRPVILREYSDRMLELLLKANRPEKYRERIDVSGKVQHTMRTELDERIDSLLGQFDRSGSPAS